MMSIMPLQLPSEVGPGDDLAAMLGDAITARLDVPAIGDVLVVTQKIISKSEGRFRRLSSVTPGAEALSLAAKTGKDARLLQLVLEESSAIVRAAPGVVIARHRSGHVMANAGIDRSNTGDADDDVVLLLPHDADRSAALLRNALGHRLGIDMAVVISDSFGRPWRLGVVNVAVGAAGFPSLIDVRGESDRDGRRLEVTQIAAADLIAAAAGLMMGEARESVPAVIVRGYCFDAPERAARDLVRPAAEDLFA